MTTKQPLPQNVCFETLQSQESDHFEPIATRILRVQQDLSDLHTFYPILTSPTRHSTLISYIGQENVSIQKAPFNSYSQDEKVDYLLLRNFLFKSIQQIELDGFRDFKTAPLIIFAGSVVSLCEDRRAQISREPRDLAGTMNEISKAVVVLMKEIKEGQEVHDKDVAFRAARTIDALKDHLEEWFSFFKDYDPGFTWWVAKPFELLRSQLGMLSTLIREEFLGIKQGG